MGTHSAIIADGDKGAIVSRELTAEDVQNGALQVWNFMMSGNASVYNGVYIGLTVEPKNESSTQNDTSEPLKFCTVNDAVAAGSISGLWAGIDTQECLTIPQEIREDLVKLASGENENNYRIAIVNAYPQVKHYGYVYVDSFAVGNGLTGLDYMFGTSMATPVVSGMLALAAANSGSTVAGSDYASELCARVYGSVVKDDALADKCSSSGNVTIDGMASPSPVPQSVSLSGLTATISGYYFGEGTGEVYIDGTQASIVEWSGTAGKSSVKVALPASTTTDIHKVEVKSASEKTGQKWLYFDVQSALSVSGYINLATTSGISTDKANLALNNIYFPTMGACSAGVYMLDYCLTQEASDGYDVVDNYNLLFYDYASNEWSLIVDHGKWSEVGIDTTYTDVVVAHVVNDKVYFEVGFTDSLRRCLLTYDSIENRLVNVYTFEDNATQLVSGDGNLYIIDNTITSDGIAATYVRKFDIETQTLTSVGWINSDYLSYVEKELGATCNEDYCDVAYNVVNGYVLTIISTGNEYCVFRAKLEDLNSDTITQQVGSLAPIRINTMSSNPYAYTTTDKYLVAVGILDTEEGSASRAMLYDPETDTWKIDQNVLSGQMPYPTIASCYDDTLYVWGNVDAHLDSNTEIFKKLSLKVNAQDETPDEAGSEAVIESPSAENILATAAEEVNAIAPSVITSSALGQTGDTFGRLIAVAIIFAAIAAGVCLAAVVIRSRKKL
jgi:hypothetical protein